MHVYDFYYLLVRKKKFTFESKKKWQLRNSTEGLRGSFRGVDYSDFWLKERRSRGPGQRNRVVTEIIETAVLWAFKSSLIAVI